MTRKGFTLVEILIAVALIGLSIVGLIASNISFTQANGFGADLSTAEFLVQQVRESTAMVKYSNLFSLDGISYNPPKGANGEDLVDFSAFTQQITVENVNDSDFENVVADNSSNFVKEQQLREGDSKC
ncbi:MAG: prepilin-type N-terminal cleavage/methylation domain-containing protein [Planctomycetota bacterium]|jgi:prepilin-type N-terminal cleavage/methylation domain-containing protein